MMPGVTGPYPEWDDRHSRYSNGHSGYDPYMRRIDHSPRGYTSYHDPYARRQDDAVSSRSEPYRHDPYMRDQMNYRREESKYSSRPVGIPNGNGTSGYVSSDQQSNISRDEEGYTYTLDHLATFRVGHNQGLLWPADGMQKLKMMEKSSGIWTQRMLMRLERKLIVICDHENQDEVERFPISLVQEPTAFVTNNPKEMYNNILLFTVQGDGKQKNYSPSDMHVFQCLGISAQDIVDEIRRLKAGKGLKGRKPMPIPVPVSHVPPPEVAVGYNGSVYSAAQQSRMQGGSAADVRYSVRDWDNDSISSENTERDVMMLNHCFDDIERFIAKLQQASAAYRELERRRRTRKSKKKGHGDGMLAIRARPPPEHEFVDIFQKFKLAFNLLAKLKNQIHDPNAPELVHFLFTPLALIVDACRDSNYGPNLPSRVVAPLPTAKAVDMLQNCLTSKETELWQSLGEAWTIPRHLYKGYVHPYNPIFADGWSPGFEIEDRDRVAVQAANAARMNHADEIWRAQAEAEERQQQYSRYEDNASRYSRQPSHDRYGSDYRYDGPPPDRYGKERYGGGYIEDDRRRGSYSDYKPSDYRPGPDRYEQRYAEERYFETREQTSRQGSNYEPRAEANPMITGTQVMHERAKQQMDDPLDRTRRSFEDMQQAFLKQLKNGNAKIYEVTYDRVGKNEKELTVSKGEYLEVLEDTRNWWKARNAYGRMGHVPYTILKQYVDQDANYNYVGHF